MRKLGAMDHDECAPWCDHDPVHHTEDCNSSFCDGYKCWQTEGRQGPLFHIGCGFGGCCSICGKWVRECTCDPPCPVK